MRVRARHDMARRVRVSVTPLRALNLPYIHAIRRARKMGEAKDGGGERWRRQRAHTAEELARRAARYSAPPIAHQPHHLATEEIRGCSLGDEVVRWARQHGATVVAPSRPLPCAFRLPPPNTGARAYRAQAAPLQAPRSLNGRGH